MKKTTLLLLLLLFQNKAQSSGGGWVGNSPVLMASHGGDFLPDFSSRISESDTTSEKAKNYFLNIKGEHSFDLGIAYAQWKHSSSLLLGMNYSYGISENVTYSAPLLFSFGLINNNGSGHELALTLGAPSFGYTSDIGFLFLPTLGLKYTYGTDKLRGVAEVYLSKVVALGRGSSDSENNRYNKAWILNSTLRGIYQTCDWLSLEALLGTYYQSSDFYSNSIKVGPTFQVNDTVNLFLRANAVKDSDSKLDTGVIGGAMMHF